MQFLTIHNAGGNRYSFAFLRKRLDSNIKFVPLELPGRGLRINETLLTGIPDMVDDLFEKIVEGLDAPYVLMGDCMGGLIAYLIYIKLLEKGFPLPDRLIIAGTYLPSKPADKSDTNYSKKEVQQMMLNFGISADLVSSDEFFDLLEPIITTDIKAYTAFKAPAVSPFNIPLTVLVKANEAKQIEKALNWQSKTLLPIKIHQINYQSPAEAADFVKIIEESFNRKV